MDVYEKWAVDLMSLLDAIEMALIDNDEDSAKELVMGRFGIVEKHGFSVEITGTQARGLQ